YRVPGRRGPAAERRQRPGGLLGADVRAVPMDAGLHADRRDQPAMPAPERHFWKCRDRGREGFGEHVVPILEASAEVLVTRAEGGVALRYLDPLVRVPDAFDVHAEAEAGQQLRPQLPLLPRHRPPPT